MEYDDARRQPAHFADQLPPSQHVHRQDVNDQTWQESIPDFAVFDGKNAHKGVPTIHGLLDFLQDVEENLRDWLEGSEASGEHTKNSRNPFSTIKPHIIGVAMLGAPGVRCTTVTVPADGIRGVVARINRRRVVVTNWGPGVLFVSHETVSNFRTSGIEPEQNSVQIPPPGGGAAGTGVSQNAREFRVQGELYFYPTAASSPVVDIQDEYGDI